MLPSGLKTYLVAAGIVAYAVIGYLMGYQTADEAAKMITAAIGMVTIRLGIRKAEIKADAAAENSAIAAKTVAAAADMPPPKLAKTNKDNDKDRPIHVR